LEIKLNSSVLIVIQGPTASGKTKLAIDLALHFDTQIISADARQFYSEMTIGTAKPSDIELTEVKHHFINSHSIQQVFTASNFAQEATVLLNRLFETRKVIVLVGGSNMFIDALIDGLDDIPSDVSLKKELNSILEKNGIDVFLEELKEKDPETFKTIDKNNPHRILRAIEAIRLSGQKFSELKSGNKQQNKFNTFRFALQWERSVLYDRINQRVDLMMDQGLLAEVKSLLPQRSLNALKTVGYTELFNYLDGQINLDFALDQIKQHTRNYAKRQLTWLNRYDDLVWLDPNTSISPKDQIIALLNNAKHESIS
jgi:tRNA dimethylallyltransferase